MNRTKPEMVLPASLEPDRHLVASVQERLAATTLQQVRAQVPELQREPELGTGFVVFEPRDLDGKIVEVSRPDTALLLPFTYGNNNWPNWVIRTRFMQAAIKEASNEDVRIIGLPSSTRRRAGGESLFGRHQSRMAFFKPDELRRIASSDFSPYAIRHNKIVSQLGIDTLHVFGMSYGATLGLADARHFTNETDVNLASMGLMDPATLHDKVSETQMARGFVGTIKNFMSSVQESGVPVYTRAQEAAPRYMAGQFLGSLAGTALDLTIRELYAVRRGVANGGFENELHSFFLDNTDTPVLVVAGTDSGITSAQSYKTLNNFEQIETGQLETLLLTHGHAAANQLGYIGICAAKSFARGAKLR